MEEEDRTKLDPSNKVLSVDATVALTVILPQRGRDADSGIVFCDRFCAERLRVLDHDAIDHSRWPVSSPDLNLRLPKEKRKLATGRSAGR